MALGSTQLLMKMSTRNIPGGKGGRWVELTTSPPSRAKCHDFWEPKPPGTLWATPGLLHDWFTFILLLRVNFFWHVTLCRWAIGSPNRCTKHIKGQANSACKALRTPQYGGLRNLWNTKTLCGVFYFGLDWVLLTEGSILGPCYGIWEWMR
jgi:hypothetical protein